MVVPVPSRRYDHVSGPHLYSLALDGSKAALALNDEAYGKCRVSVGWSSLPRLYQLKTRIECVCSEWGNWVTSQLCCPPVKSNNRVHYSGESMLNKHVVLTYYEPGLQA